MESGGKVQCSELSLRANERKFSGEFRSELLAVRIDAEQPDAGLLQIAIEKEQQARQEREIVTVAGRRRIDRANRP